MALEHFKSLIKISGPLPVSSFMNEALFNPKFGYYRTKNPIGKDSDFITSPEISQVFGELLAAYLVQMASVKKNKIALVEMGAGKGTLFFDILTAVKKLADKKIPQAVDFLSRTTFHIIEINEVLQKIQKEKLKDFEIIWHESFAQFAKSSGEFFFIANELFDCFAIDQFVKTDSGWKQRMIAEIDGELKFMLSDFNHELNIEAPQGAVFEYSAQAASFMNQLCQAMNVKGGMGIIIDYGYIKNDFANTLQAIKNHKKTDVLQNPGDTDLTAHVDFSLLKKIATDCGLDSSLITQREFLLGLGIEERGKALNAKLAIDRLIASDQMGELFKCLIMWKKS